MIIPNKPILQNEQILDYIPQRPPMFMIDAYYGYIGEATYSSLVIRPDNIFSEGDLFSELGMLEFMAQAGIVQFGTLNKTADDKTKPMLGFICKLKKFEIYQLPHIGEFLYAKVEKDFSSAHLATLFITAYTDSTIMIKGYFDVLSIQ